MENANKINRLHGVGRRKSAVARVFLKRGKGQILVNGLDSSKYFKTSTTKLAVGLPFKVTGLDKDYDAFVNVYGSGLIGQADAVKLGISRAIIKHDEKYRLVLRDHNLLTVDSRLKERKKYGQKAARRKFQFVKR